LDWVYIYQNQQSPFCLRAQAIVRLADNGNHIPPPPSPPVSNGFAVPTGYPDSIYARHSITYAPRPAFSVPDVLVSPVPSGWHSGNNEDQWLTKTTVSV